jgi:rRNA-processing protein FCF1
MKQVIIDTNALIAIETFKIDVFEEIENCLDVEYELCVVDGTIKELIKLKVDTKLSGKDKTAAKLALTILEHKIKNKKITVIKDDPKIDVDSTLALFSSKKALVLTQDKGLKSRLTKPYLTIRQKKRVVLIE